ncbi:MAG: DUF4416 family protein [Candidatus Omnitrophica bacterium]|nr:DUF4416 family protein [Candidatus Omnitrophota bacterium]
MGTAAAYPPVKLVAGFIFSDDNACKKARAALVRRFGAIDFESGVIPFTYTDYYEKEFGTGLKRVFVSFKRLVPLDRLARIKAATNSIENSLAVKKYRPVNIDPGFVDLAKLVLATTKDFCHRIYLSKGIFAEVTLVYKDRSFRHWEWTYPDYRTPEYIAIFNHIRELYAKQLKK